MNPDFTRIHDILTDLKDGAITINDAKIAIYDLIYDTIQEKD